jgi:hypothetical protein
LVNRLASIWGYYNLINPGTHEIKEMVRDRHEDCNLAGACGSPTNYSESFQEIHWAKSGFSRFHEACFSVKIGQNILIKPISEEQSPVKGNHEI